jgi:16S rRNA (adenine1518-N6/adenine1519-N6)-dimethyltransferase
VKHQPRKRFGQHFLVDESVLVAIADAVAPRAGDTVVEIGPGLGALTAHLLGRIEQLHAVEIDRDLVARLARRFPPARLVLHEADALAFDFGSLAGTRALRVVGNLPYNISSPLLIRLLDFRDRIVDQHFMLQKEVVARIAGQPGTSDYGRLTVMMQAFHQVVDLFDVPPQAFDPPPRVDSSVVRMVPRAQPLVADFRSLERLLAVAFSQRRKMLRGTLIPWLRQQGIDVEAPAFGLVPTARPEEVTVEQYAAIADALHAAANAANAAPAAPAAPAATG